MIKDNKFKLTVSSLLILLPIAVGLVIWDKIPDTLATHWDLSGNANGWSGKEFTVFGIPLIMLALQWVCVIASSFDIKNSLQNKKLFGLVFWIIPFISFAVFGVIYGTALGKSIDVAACCILMLAVMFIVIGNYIPKARQNRTLGIKIKWTLEDEGNWNATHRFAGKVWVICGFCALFCYILPDGIMTWALTAVLAIAVIAPLIYSYLYKTRHK